MAAPIALSTLGRKQSGRDVRQRRRRGSKDHGKRESPSRCNLPADFGVSLHAMSRTPIVALALEAVLVFSAASAQASPGQLDPTFGDRGVVITSIQNHGGFASGLALQPDGKVVVVGSIWRSPGSAFVLARYKVDGSLDPTFGQGGAVITPNDSDYSFGSDVALQSDGKIVVAGTSGLSDHFALARYDEDGSLDRTFGAGGRVSTSIGERSAIRALALQGDGKIVAAGWGDGGFALARYLPDGSLDRTFGARGIAKTTIGLAAGATSLAIQPDGKLVAGGEATISYRQSLALVRYNEDGSLDRTFGKRGIVIGGWNPNAAIYSIALQTDGKIVAAGTAGGGFALARYRPDGSLDPNFGSAGIVRTIVSGGYSWAYSVAIAPNGNIIAAGPAGGSFGLARYTQAGALDPSFGDEGIALIWICLVT
jgi:uncharacterized delta-60 repeat protein